MGFAKLLLGAAVGAALGIALLVTLEAFAHLELSWIVIVIGILTGLAMRWIGGTGRASYLRGAVAALVTLATFIGGKYVVASVLSSMENQGTTAPIAADRVENPQGDAAPTGVGAEPVLRVMEGRPAGDAMNFDFKRRNISVLDAVWLIVGALVAYELGKGAAAKPMSPQPMPDSPAQPSGEIESEA